MASALEVGKLVSASFIYRYWNIVNWLQKIYMTIAVVILIGITSMGIFGFLSNSYMGATQGFESITTKLSVYKEQLTTLEEDKVFLKQELQVSVDALPDNYITAKRKLREEYNPLIQEKSVLIGELKNKIGELEIELVDTGVDVGPLIYISEQFDTDMDTVVGWIMFILILVFDPLAVLMIISFNIAYINLKKEEELTYEEEYELHDRGRNTHFDDSDFDEERIDVIGQNGNDGLHYEEDDDSESFLEQKEKEDELEKEVERLEKRFPNKEEQPEVYGDEERTDVYPNEKTEATSSEKRNYPEQEKFKNDIEKVMSNMNIGKIVVKEPGTPEGEDVVEVVKEETEENRGLSWQRANGKGSQNADG